MRNNDSLENMKNKIEDDCYNKIKENEKLSNSIIKIINYLESKNWASNIKVRIERLPEETVEEIVVDVDISSKNFEKALNREDEVFEKVSELEPDNIHIFPLTKLNYEHRNRKWVLPDPCFE